MRLGADEADLLRSLATEMRVLLGHGADAGDAVTRRLLPDAYEDGADSEAYRTLTQDDLIRSKLGALDVLEATLEEGKHAEVDALLSAGETHAWLTALTDMRLAIGTRMEVTEATMSGALDEGGAIPPALAVLHWLGWTQELMLEALTSTGEQR